MENSSTEHDSEHDSIEDILETIKNQAFEIDKDFQSVFEKIKDYRDSIDDETTLIAKPRLKQWLVQRGMSPILSFHEFFEVFLEEHKTEGRLDLATRTIDLREDARSLFRPKFKKQPVYFLDFLHSIDQLFE